MTEPAAIDDPELLNRHSAYLDQIRALGRVERIAGLVAILVGAGLVIWARTTETAPAWPQWLGYGLLAAGWAAVIYVMVRRSRWVRANPFDPNP